MLYSQEVTVAVIDSNIFLLKISIHTELKQRHAACEYSRIKTTQVLNNPSDLFLPTQSKTAGKTIDAAAYNRAIQNSTLQSHQ